MNDDDTSDQLRAIAEAEALCAEREREWIAAKTATKEAKERFDEAIDALRSVARSPDHPLFNATNEQE
jgi:hypothetical protein